MKNKTIKTEQEALKRFDRRFFPATLKADMMGVNVGYPIREFISEVWQAAGAQGVKEYIAQREGIYDRHLDGEITAEQLVRETKALNAKYGLTDKP